MRRACSLPRRKPERIAEAWYNLADLLDDQGRSESAKPSSLRPITLMQCSIWRYYCNEKARMAKQRIIGGGI